MKLRLVAVPMLVLGLAPASAEDAAPPQVGESRGFGDWIVGCGNEGACTAIGMSEEMAANLAYLRITRAAGPDAAPRMALSLWPDATQAGTTLALELVGGRGGALPIERLEGAEEGGYVLADVAEADVAPLLDALVRGDGLRVRADGDGEPALVSLKGMSAALRYMDAEQGRDGGVTAIVARGDEPADAVPPAPGPAAPVPALRLTELDPAPPLPQGVPPVGEDCGEVGGHVAYEAANGARIFGVCRFSAAYNQGEEYWLADEQGVRRLSFRLPDDPGPPDFDGLVNAGLDEGRTTLSDFNKGRGLGDCGSFSTWSFDGRAMQLVALSAMGECRGVSPGDWPVLYSRATAAE